LLETLSSTQYKYTLPKWADVEVDKSADSKPRFAFSHFNGEVKATFLPNVAGIYLPAQKDEVITFAGNEIGFGIRQAKTGSAFNEHGGFDLELLLKTRPKSNILPFSFDSTNLVPFHQPELTAKEKAMGAVRPAYVVNSIAWYHSSRGGCVSKRDIDNGITTGKAFHQYAMQMVDAKGATAWAGWFLNGTSEIWLVLDEKLLAEGTYPILVKPVGDTFGYTSVGASNTQTNNATSDVGAAHKHLAVTGDTITGFSAYASRGAYSATALSMAAYTVVTGLPAARLAEGVAIGVDTTPAWYSVTGLSQALVNGATYSAAQTAGAATSTAVYYDTSATDDYTENTGATLTDPWSSSYLGKFRVSMYATYTAGGGSTAVSDELQAIWNVRAAVSDTVQAIYNVRAAVSDTLQAIWNVRTTVSDTLQAVWNIRATVSDTVQAIWNVRAVVSDTVQAIWNVLSNLVLKTIALTLKTRSRSFTLRTRSRSLTLQARSRNLTLPERD
jgi:hypothetical protein